MSDTTTRPTFENISNKIRLSIEQMYSMLTELTHGWPKKISDSLCYREGDELKPLSSPPELFAWIDRYAEVQWQRGGVTKEEFFQGLRQSAEEFSWSSAHPHFPKIPNVYYTCKFPKAKNTGALDELLSRFSPATKLDGKLLKAMVLTLFWGGPPGKRPSFVITTDGASDPDKGCGAGKTTLAEMMSSLVGGYISVRPQTSQDRTIAGLLSPPAWSKRVAIIDNLKTYRFSNDMIESLVTGQEINGHRLHHGNFTRPNLLTWVVTVNGASFSKDMAQRSVVIMLRRPKTGEEWYKETVGYIEEHRRQIIRDVRWHLDKAPEEVKNLDRWPDWVAGVLCRLDDPEELLKELRKRRSIIDEDDQDAEDVIDHVRACLREALQISKPDEVKVKIPALLLSSWLRSLKSWMSDRAAAQYLKHMQSPLLRYQRTSKCRSYIWVGPKAGDDAPPLVLTYTANVCGR